MKLQFLLGLFLLSLNLIGQSNVDQYFLDSIKEVNINSYQLSSQYLDSAFEINTQLIERLGVNEETVLFKMLSYAPVDTLVLSDIYSSRANMYFLKGEYYKSLRCNLNALQLRRLINDTVKIAGSLNNIGNMFYYKGGNKDSENYIKSIEYYSQSYNLLKAKSASPCKQLLPLNGLGLVYRVQGKNEESSRCFNIGLEILKNCPKDDRDRAQLYGNYGELLFNMGNVKEAIEYLNQSLQLNMKLERTTSLTWNFAILGKIYLDQKEYNKSYFYLNKADSTAQLSSTLEMKKDIRDFLLQHKMKRAGYFEMLEDFEDYKKLKNLSSEEKTNQNIQDAETKYQTAKKEAALALEKKENEANKLYLSIAIIGLIALALTFFFTHRNNKQKREIALLELKAQQQEIDELLSNQESESFAAMLKGQEEERERIAQDLHDRLGGTLAALKHSLRREENQVEEEDLEIIDQAVVEVRDIAHNLSGGLLEKQGLNVALEQLKKTIERSKAMQFKLYLHSSMAELGQEVALELYRIVQELCNNVLKHSYATEMSLQTSVNEQTFNLILEDNGVGFDKKEINEGIGMLNLQKRVKRINGSLHIDSEKGRGTIAIIELDLKA